MPRTTPRHRPEFYIGINRSFKNHMFSLQDLDQDLYQASDQDQDQDPYPDQDPDQDLDQHSISEEIFALRIICFYSKI